MEPPKSNVAGSKKKKNKNKGSSSNGLTAADRERRAMVRPLKKSVPKPSRDQFANLANTLTPQDESLHRWLATVANPWTKNPSGAPVIYGDMADGTVMLKFQALVNPKPNALGVCFAGFMSDGWLSLNDGFSQTIQRLLTASPYGGSFLYYTDNNYLGTVAPTMGDIPDVVITYTAPGKSKVTKIAPPKGVRPGETGYFTTLNGLYCVNIPLLSSDVNLDADYRMVAGGLRVRPLLGSGGGASTDRGQFLLATTRDPTAGPNAGGLSGTAWQTLHNNSEVTIKECNVVGWKPEKTIHAVCVPTDDVCFQMTNIISASDNTDKVGYPSILFAANACPNDGSFAFELEAVINYEVTPTTSWRVEPPRAPTIPADRAHMQIAASNMRPTGASSSNGNAENFVMPMVKTLATTAPHKLPGFIKTGGSKGGLLSSIGSFVGDGIKWLTGEGKSTITPFLSKIPGIGGIIGSVLGGL